MNWSKLMSGRLWLTFIAGFVFAYAVISKQMNSEATAAIITTVFMAYFQRNRNGEEKKS